MPPKHLFNNIRWNLMVMWINFNWHSYSVTMLYVYSFLRTSDLFAVTCSATRAVVIWPRTQITPTTVTIFRLENFWAIFFNSLTLLIMLLLTRAVVIWRHTQITPTTVTIFRAFIPPEPYWWGFSVVQGSELGVDFGRVSGRLFHCPRYGWLCALCYWIDRFYPVAFSAI